MVKVQKPQTKTLTKSNKLEGVLKDKQKQSKSKKTAKTAATVDVAEIKKVAVKKSEIKKENLKPSVAAKTKAAKKDTAVAVKPVPKSKPAKKPLVLAPPESPAAPAPKVSKKVTAAAKKENVPEAKSVKAVVAKKSVENVANKPAKQQKQVKPEKPAKASKTSVPADKVVKKPLKPVQAKQPQLATAAKKPAKNQVDAALKTVTKKVSKAVDTKSKVAKSKVAKSKATKSKVAKNKKASKKITPKVIELNYELKPFNEDKFNEILTKKNVQKVCEALKTQVADEVQKRQKAIFSDYRFILQVCSYKIPSCPKRMVKLALKHSLIGVDDDVAVIVTDLQRGARVDYEPTVQHYEDLLREAGIKQRLTVVPFNRLRNDMGTYEAKRKFVNTYDYLLCDGRISGQTTAFLGQCAQKARNVLHAVRLNKGDQLAKEFTRALCRTAYRQLSKGDLTAIPIGNHEHSPQQLAENILMVVQQLQQQYPGGLANIRSMYLKIDIVGTSALPLYVSMCAPPADTPYVVGPREQRMLKLKKQANEVLTKFALTKDVDFIKLTTEQVKRKAELREKRNALKAEDAKDKEDGDEPVPAKKARKNAAEETAEVNDADDIDEEDDAEDDDDDDEEVVDGEGDDDDGDDDDDDDDEEGGDDDDEEDDDDDEDEEDE